MAAGLCQTTSSPLIPLGPLLWDLTHLLQCVWLRPSSHCLHPGSCCKWRCEQHHTAGAGSKGLVTLTCMPKALCKLMHCPDKYQVCAFGKLAEFFVDKNCVVYRILCSSVRNICLTKPSKVPQMFMHQNKEVFASIWGITNAGEGRDSLIPQNTHTIP